LRKKCEREDISRFLQVMRLKYAIYSVNDDKANETHEKFRFLHFNSLLHFININKNVSLLYNE